ncbi:hypothetical protein [Streptomyces celluloflavus]|uniref:hypothetical protein n=1 Tax=Streptomyces celluloflavus TaxID=58344 RepID=UPI0034605573|nr:hypothetical protein OG717_29620 [Streptomyces celluloflavus]
MTMNGARVPLGAVQAAWDQRTALQLKIGTAAQAKLFERIRDATALYGPHELTRGTIFLIGGALAGLSGEGPEAAQFADAFTEQLVIRLSEWSEFVDPADLPMIRQVVAESFTHRDPVAWRDRSGPVPDSERRALTCTLAIITDFVDRVDGPGSCERQLLAALGNVLD